MNKEQFYGISLHTGLKIAEINDDGLVYRISDICSSRYNDFVNQNYYKPILRPLSDLTKPIEHKGEIFTPMVELARINFGSNFMKTLKTIDSDMKSVIFLGRGDTGGDEPEYIYGKVLFDFSPFHLSFSAQDLNDESVTHCDTIYQLKSLLKLIEWHFDIAGLIDIGEAIDVNTLTENPYK